MSSSLIMNTQIIKTTLPNLVKSCSQFFELDFTIKLFGVKIFSFHWPPQPENDDVESSKIE